MPVFQDLTPNEQLKKASAEGDNNLVQMLFAQGGVDVEFFGPDGYTALRFAAQNGHPEVVSTLLDNGAKINAVDYMGRSAMTMALSFNHYDVVNILAEKGASMLIASLVLADVGKHQQELGFLVQEYVKDIDFNAIDPDYTAVMAVVQSSNRYFSPHAAGPALESLMEGVVGQLLHPTVKLPLDLDQTLLELVGIDQALPGFFD